MFWVQGLGFKVYRLRCYPFGFLASLFRVCGVRGFQAKGL